MIRSLLYVPASSERFVAKAHERGADAIVLDLEDSVAPGEKAPARAALAESVRSAGRNGATVFVRINADSELVREDAEAACRAGAFGLFVPKAGSAGDLRRLDRWLTPLEQAGGREPVRLVPLIEDPSALLEARGIAGAPRVFAMVTGGEDLATAMGAEPTPEVLEFPKLTVHYAAKAAGVLSWGLLRTVADYSDHAGIEQSARQARAFGFDGATCVHPAVVPILNRAFSPGEAEIERARAIVALYEQARSRGKGAVEFEGRMIDEPVAQRARALLERSRA